MSTTTVPVTLIAADQNGNAVAGARVKATLNMTEVYQGFVVPETVEVFADAAGQAVLQLWPNALGVAGSRYRVQAWNPDTGKKFLDTLVSVPNSACAMHEILVQEPYPAVDASQQALVAAQGVLALVTAQAQIATTQATSATASKVAAQASETAAQSSSQAAASENTQAQSAKTAAQASAATASAQASTATTQASAASASASAAAADRVQTAADRVQTGLDKTQTAADRVATGQDRDQVASDKTAVAADRVQTGQDRSATAADRVQVAQDAATATTQAATATTNASAAASSATAAANSATAATGSATSAATSAATATTQAATATTQAASATASSLAAANALDAFDDRFLGAKATNPTLDNDGQTLLVGALYWNTTESAMRAWSGTAWIDTNELDGRILADQQLLGAITYATDMALKGLDGITENRGTFGSTDRAELYAYMFGELLDKIGVIGRAISGGAIELQAGTAAIPSLTSATDVATGVFFPANGVLAMASAGVERLRITADGRLGLGTTTPTGLLDVADNKLRVRTAQTPASATAAGNQGDIAWDASFVYVCINTNAWRRAALSTW